MEFIKKKTDELKYANYNPRKKLKPEDKEYQKIKKSIEEFGYVEPIIINKDNTIIGGHQRLTVLKDLGYKEVDVIQIDIDKTKEKALNIALNKITGEWDYSMLGDLLLDLDSLNYDLEFTGFDLDEIENILAPLEEEKDKEEKNNFYYFSKEEIQNDIVNGWHKYENLDEYVKNIIDLPTAKYQYNRLCQGYNDGYNISLLFNQHRLNTETIKSKSIFYAINNDDKYKKEYARFILNVENKVVPYTQYYKYIGLGNAGYQYVNEFPPYLARDIYKNYCKDGDKILNPCAGWGGRLIGLSSCLFKNIEYVETDPQKQTFEGLKKIKKFLKLNDNYKQYNLPFEKLELKENYFDFTFTSPPYFDTERYSDDETQSYKNKNNYNDWKIKFLYTMLDKIYYSLKVGGICLLNVGKVRYPIDDDIIDYMKTKYNINCTRIKKFKYGGSGIGNRTDDEGNGEPFIEFKKK